MKRQLLTAQTAEHQAKAEAARDQQQRGSLGELLKSAALQRGVPLHQLDEASQYFQSGQLPGKYELPSALPGPTMPKPQYADPGLGAQIMQQLGLTRQALTLGDKNVEHVAGAAGKYQQQDAVRQVQADPTSAGRVGQAFAAAKGDALVDNIGNTGETFNKFTGDGGVASAGLRALYGDVQGANILKDKAAASNSYASAGQHRAQTDKIRQELERDVRTGDLQVVTGPDGAITVVNKRQLSAQPVLGADGKPVIKGAAGGGGKPMTEGQAKANIYGGRMLESDKILSELEDKGITNAGLVKGVVQGTLGILPLVGDKLGEAAGGVMNTFPTYAGGPNPQQQQVDQARRDFINAVLRRESGATIQPHEFANAEKQYFPQPGDSKEVLAQKRRNRQIATTLMLQEVPDAQRYRGRAPVAAPAAAATSAPEGSWGAPAGRTVKVDY
jgi:hypothetical protein